MSKSLKNTTEKKGAWHHRSLTDEDIVTHTHVLIEHDDTWVPECVVMKLKTAAEILNSSSLFVFHLKWIHEIETDCFQTHKAEKL